MKRFAEDIERLCEKYSDLSVEDVALIRHSAKVMP